ncbi:MAG: PorT family protein [Sporocytophaga sp.]|nr:PorT family protein [Sporocytophaga sp.]
MGIIIPKRAFRGGVFVQIPLYKRFSLLTEVLYTQKRFVFKERLFNYSTIELPETQTYFEVPVLLNFNFGREKWVPYVNAGISISYLAKSKMSPLRKDSLYIGGGREVKEGEIDVTDLRQRLNYNLILGAGIKVKNVIGRGYIFLDVRYCHGLNKLNDPDKRYSNDDLMYKYFYTDSDFKINSFQYSLGYSYPLYKPKLKRKTKEKYE